MSTYNNISYEVKEGIAHIGFGLDTSKSMTTLTIETLTELDDAIDVVAADKSLKGLVFFTHREGCFLAGVDVSVISSLTTESYAIEGCEKGQGIYNKIEDLEIPSICCIDGVCLGGGLELALSCNHILASDNPKTKLGLPEVMLGILPGFGGTYRLPRKIGLMNALDLILTGKQIPSKKAKKLGLVTEVYPVQRLIDMAHRHFKKKHARSSTMTEKVMDNFIGKKVVFQKARETVLKKTKGFYQAPLKILDLMESGGMKSRNSYLSMEASAFAELALSEQSKNLQHIFFISDAAKKYKKNTEQDKEFNIKRGAVIGAGTMGGGIAWLFANNNQAPYMKDLNQDALELGLKQSSRNFMKSLKRKKMSQDEFERLQRSIIPTTNYNGFKKVDLVVEAIVENMDIKKKVFCEAERYVRDDCLLTSNTSSLSVEEMALALEKPDRFGGLHFFNPVNMMPLVEIITHSKMSESTKAALYKWCLKAKKTPIIVNDGPGFLVNRILTPFLNEAIYLLEEGVPAKELDQAILNFGMPMGPCRLLDEIGLDVMAKVGKVIFDGLGNRVRPSELGQKIADTGFYGKKSGKGFYIYDSAGKPTEENEEVMKLFPAKKINMDEKEIQMRAILPMINEASIILAEQITDNPQTVDIGMIYGIGFPPFRGGLLKYADHLGLDSIGEKLDSYAQTVDENRYKMSDFLRNLISTKKKFYDL